MVGIICKNGSNLADSEVEALLEIYEGLRIPDLLVQFLPGDDFPRPADQQG